jgi:hypothetical protein
MRRFGLAAASVAVLACLGACSDGDVADAQPAPEPTVSAEPTPTDPFAWTDVPYKDYLDAAHEIGLRPDVLVPESGFSSGLNTLCHTTPTDFAALRKSQQANTSDTDTYTTAKYLSDEVGLRLGLACPQRMGDWAATSDDRASADEADDDVSTVTDEDLARAEAEEAAASHEPDDQSGENRSPDPGPSDDVDVSTTSNGAATAGNSAPER